MLRRAIPIVVVSAFLGGCTAHHKPANTQGTLADLHKGGSGREGRGYEGKRRSGHGALPEIPG